MHIANFAEGGQFEPQKIATALRTSAEEIALTVGLGKDALQRRTRIGSDKTQRRLRELVEVLNKVEPRFGSELMAYAWYRSEPLPGFDGHAAGAGRQSAASSGIRRCGRCRRFCLMPLKDERYTRPLYRALNPVYAREPLSGRGAELYGGRFNSKGTPALYTSLDPSTALREANQVGSLQPTILVSYIADLGPIFDTGDQDGLEQYDMTTPILANPAWRMKMLTGQLVPTQDLARALIADWFAGLLIQSFAKGASSSDVNILLWAWTDNKGSLEVVDDEERLSRM